MQGLTSVHRRGWDDIGAGDLAYRLAWADALRHLVGQPPLRVVEVGSGPGSMARLLAAMGHRVTGYDRVPAAVERARALAGGGSVTFEVGDAYRLPQARSTADVVVSRRLFSALDEPARASREWRRVLAPAGRIVVIDQPGARWRTPEGARAELAAAGMAGSTVYWLDEVHRTLRRTSPLRARLARGLGPFFALVWQSAAEPGADDLLAEDDRQHGPAGEERAEGHRVLAAANPEHHQPHADHRP